MKSLKFAFAGALLGAFAAPLGAQSTGFEGYKFVDAVRSRDGDTAMQLLQSTGPRIVDAKDAKGDTALIAAITNGDERFTAFLLTKGADPNLAGKGGDTPLIAAARANYADAAEWLLGQGAKIDLANRMGETPLIIAVQQREPRIVKLLLDNGANPDKTDSAAGYSARDYATRDTRARDILQMIQQKKPKTGS
jgi:ankyrin repeat protein